jgi:hypothetical protein
MIFTLSSVSFPYFSLSLTEDGVVHLLTINRSVFEILNTRYLLTNRLMPVSSPICERKHIR